MQAQLAFDDAVCGNLVVEKKAIAVGTEHKGHLKHLSITQSLLHAIADGVGIVFGLDDGKGDIWLIEQHIISPLMLSAGVQLATNYDPPLGQWELFTDLGDNIPSGLL